VAERIRYGPYHEVFREEDPAFERMQALFADLRRSTGAIVISASSGIDTAQESKDIHGGALFTAFRDALVTGHRRVSDARAYTITRVLQITSGHQHPDVRSENLANDWDILNARSYWAD
jgi:hypothetical protein